jgi:hypothetical protein
MIKCSLTSYSRIHFERIVTLLMTKSSISPLISHIAGKQPLSVAGSERQMLVPLPSVPG